MLRLGSRGKAVKDLQEKLGISDDGIFGQGTESAVKEFQRKNGLIDDGVVGPKTISLLTESVSKYKAEEIENDEDFDDPDDEMDVDDTDTDDEDDSKLTSNAIELMNLIMESDITRNVKKIVYHCTATSQKATVKGIKNYWKNNLGWKSPGYHIIVKPNGEWSYLLNFNSVSNGVRGKNSISINVSYIGGIDSNGKALDNRTDEQKEVYEAIYRAFSEKLPNVTHHGHYEFSSKSCPSFNVQEWEKEIS